MRNLLSKRIILPRFRQLRFSLLLSLLLLLSICSATDSFQQLVYNNRKEQQKTASSLHTATAVSGISVVPAIRIYGGGAITTDTTSSSSVAPLVRKKLRGWDIFDREDRRSTVQQPQQRRRLKLRRRSTAVLDDEEYQRRKQEWADRYTTLEGLRSTFGCNRNKLYGDLDAVTTRKLYITLLPTAVCELVLDVEVRPEELAPLAFEARKAAKLYARERCHVPARLLAKWYDGFRALKRYGRFQIEGMTYDQVFDKYYRRSTMERALSISPNRTEEREHARRRFLKTRNRDTGGWTEEDIVAQTCMKILESACRTNPLIDRMTLSEEGLRNRRSSDKGRMNREDLEKIAQTLEDDVRKLLDPYKR
eukprot:CAMPEP_0197187680 /NCGR_PEP_ID=MMETSP1423-20130617/16333_1 /TAXON_ID=476441 /ORGANISM="Pseudo-nitzschia heimii, Strain UNC1101" /LENGTH=363 /DNA_ID=CAMNT_0042639323 /DNA_START=40 /DNA_END=1131 /DNA_ORIENTATION=+